MLPTLIVCVVVAVSPCSSVAVIVNVCDVAVSQSNAAAVSIKPVDELIVNAKKWYTESGNNIRKLYILTHESNVHAHKFYKKIGFTHETTLKDHYYNGQDERVYVKFFDQEGF